jgi:coniferyl-aldehyde dehydrogenase
VVEQTHSGDVCLNDTPLHAVQDHLPFGGIGASGMRHPSSWRFSDLGKAKAVFIKQKFNAASLIYPPYGNAIQKLIRWLLVR